MKVGKNKFCGLLQKARPKIAREVKRCTNFASWHGRKREINVKITFKKTRQMNVTSFYNHAAFTKSVKEGREIVNSTKCGYETQLYKVGDIVRAASCCPYNFKRAKVVEVYKENGYFRYLCKIGKFERICRGKDIELI